MGKIWRINILAGVIAAIVAMNSCTSSQCMENQSSIPLAGFYSMSSKAAITVDSLRIYGVGVPNDSTIVDNGAVSQVYLPLRFTASQTQYVLHYNNKALDNDAYNDTLTIRYDAYPYFESEACGAMYNFAVIDYGCTSHLVDSVAITVPTFTNRDIESVKIYFKTSEQ